MRNLFFAFLIFSLGCQSSKKENQTDEAPTAIWLTDFSKPAENPILQADSNYIFNDPITNTQVKWQKADVFNPGAIVKEDTVFLLFRAEDNPKAGIGGRTSRIGLAYSLDGINFKKFNDPVLYPSPGEFAKWDTPGGCEDPRIVEYDGGYVMLYTSWDGKTARLSAASSTDLRNWDKHGPVFEEAMNGKYLDLWSKSGSIVTEIKDGRLQAARINGKYWMYWGELFVNAAYTDNMIDWTPMEGEDGELLHSLDTRNGKFDSFLTEPGPPALLTENGILMLYNGKNSEDDIADPNIARGTYCGGQALFEANNPEKLIERLDQPFICPDLPHEVTGQYTAGTTFIEGLVYFKNKWFLYYGTADSMVGLAVSN